MRAILKAAGVLLALVCGIRAAALAAQGVPDPASGPPGRPAGAAPAAARLGGEAVDFAAIATPILFKGDAVTAYRDPAAVYHEGVFRLFFTLVQTEEDGSLYSYTAWSKSADLVRWTAPKILTPRDRNLNFCSPGNAVRFGNEWVLCLQTYPRPRGEKFGNQTARVWVMRSADLETWGPPQLLRVKGPDVPVERMGRMIDPFLLEDKDEPGKWWCFYKQNGLSMSWSRDLVTWTYFGRADAGENACVLVDGGEYVLFHSPGNGIGVKRSRDLKDWRDAGLITLGQTDWPWARGRLTAGFGRLFRAGKLPVNMQLGAYYNVEHPDFGPE